MGALDFDIRLDPLTEARLALYLRNVKHGIPRARSAAIKKTTAQVYTLSRRAVASEIGITQSKLKRRVSKRILGTNLSVRGGVISFSPYRIPLKMLGPRQSRAGVSVGGRGNKRTVSGAFIAPTLGGHVFARKAGAGRLPIVRLDTVSPAHLAEHNPAISSIATSRGPEILRKQVSSQIDRLLARRR